MNPMTRRLLALPALLALLVACTPQASLPTATPVRQAPQSTPIERPAAIIAPTEPPTATTAPTAAPRPTVVPPSATPAGPTVIPTPSPRPAGTPPRVGIQVGHYRAEELPEELARFRTSTGARYGDTTEAELNYAIAVRVQALLEAEEVVVDLLPATIPPSYDADAFLAIHADGSTGAGPRGWKLATPWRASTASQNLLAAVAATYPIATGLPEDVGGITVNMRGYYAFNYRRHVHAIARTTPAIIVEMGFMTNAADRAVLFGQPDRVAAGIAEGVLDFLDQRDPNDGAALLPPDLPLMRAMPGGATIRSSPSDNGRVLFTMGPDDRFAPFSRRGDWYEGVVRGQWRVTGWVRVDQVEPSGEPVTFPTPTNP